MSAGFTPGPWRATPFSSVVGCPITAQPDPKKNTIVLAGVYGAFGDDYRLEVQANAHLIAAAPDMFEALDGFVRQWNACGPNSDFGRYFQPVRDTAVAALAKAQGATK